MGILEKVDEYINSWRDGKSAVVDSWFMMSSPKPVVSVVILYVVFITIGPRFMKSREPFRMTKLISYYNAAQVALAATICYKVLRLNLFRDGILYAGCRYPSTTLNPLLLDGGWWYFFAKLSELLDTVFFVLKKKNRQITFLHVYHHVVMVFYSWSYLKFASGGEGSVLALLNSVVHIVMYSYYLLSGLGPKFQKYLWWKKHVTKMQLIQFILMLSYCTWTYHLPKCQFAPSFTYFITANVTIFLVLFLNFYIKSYNKKGDAKEFMDTKRSFNGNCKTILTGCVAAIDDKFNKCDGDNALLADELSKGDGVYVKDGKPYFTRRNTSATVSRKHVFTCSEE